MLITAKITTTALLFFLLLFTLTTNLRAQESGQQARKQGWFVGVSPFSFIGAEIKTSRTTTTEVDVVAGAATFDYQATIVSHFVNDSRGLTNGVITDAEAKQSLIRGAIELCKRSNAADATTGRIVDTVPLDPNSAVNSDYPTIDTRDFYIGYVGGQYNEASVDVTTEICDLPDIPPTVPNPTPPEPSASESAISLQGALAIQFGYNLGKYRVSLTSFSNKGGANRLTNNVLLADWFLTPGVYAGLGITSAKLETEIGSASQTAPAFNLGYARKIGNLQLEAGYLVLNSSFSIQKQQTLISEPNTQNLPLGGAETQTLGETGNARNRIGGFRFGESIGNYSYYSVVSVTRTPVSATSVTTTTTTTTEKVELPSQQVIYLRLVWKFR